MTAVEWLIDYIKNLEKYPYKTIQELEEQAKEMEYKQSMDAIQKGMEIQQKYNSRKGFRERNNLLNDKTNR